MVLPMLTGCWELVQQNLATHKAQVSALCNQQRHSSVLKAALTSEGSADPTSLRGGAASNNPQYRQYPRFRWRRKESKCWTAHGVFRAEGRCSGGQRHRKINVVTKKMNEVERAPKHLVSLFLSYRTSFYRKGRNLLRAAQWSTARNQFSSKRALPRSSSAAAAFP